MWVLFLYSEQDWNSGARRVVREACGGSQLCERSHTVELVRFGLIVGAELSEQKGGMVEGFCEHWSARVEILL